MFSFLPLAALLVLSTAHASPVMLTSITNLTVGTVVRIIDTRSFDISVDADYPLAPEFTPVVSVPPLATTMATAQDWVLIPQDTGTFLIQSAMFPDMYISYASIGIAAMVPIHSPLVLRGIDNAVIFSLLTISGGTKLNIVINATGKQLTAWTNSLVDTTSPITVANAQAGATSQMFQVAVIGESWLI